MFASFGLVPSWLRPSPRDGTRALDLPQVDYYESKTSDDHSARSLKHYIKANHANHSIIYNNLRFHNHAPHILASSYIIGASPEQLSTIYDAESANLEPWKDSPGEISKEDWRDYLGNREYQRAYANFFEDQLVAFGYDWKRLIEHFFFEGKEPLINSLSSGLGHCLIHLGYAYEINSREVAIEALGLTACFYNDFHKYVDDPSYTKPSKFKSKSTLDLLKKVKADDRFDKLFASTGPWHIEAVPKIREEAMLEYWNAWDISSDPKASFEESQWTATALVDATHDNRSDQYDFFLLHLLTTSHAVRILLPIIPAKFQISLVRQWWLFTIMTYVGQMRPNIDASKIEKFPVEGRSWKDVDRMALTSEHATDAHYVKGLRAMKNAAETWKDQTNYYLKAALKFGTEFNGWGGGTSVDDFSGRATLHEEALH